MNPNIPLGTVETVIDGHRYEIQMMAATPARRLLLRILKVIGFPVDLPRRTPETKATLSCSIFWRTERPYPP